MQNARAPYLPTPQRVRLMVVVLAAGILPAGCVSPTSTQQSQLDCQTGFYQVGNQCVPDPNLVTIDVKSGTYTYFGTACPAFSPNPVSVKVNQDFRFHNDTGASVTIIGYDKTPWVSASAGAASNALNFSKAGQVLYTSYGCAGAPVTTQAWGHINVTVN